MRIKNLQNIENVLNYGLKIMGKWSDDLLLKYNRNKTKSAFFYKIKTKGFSIRYFFLSQTSSLPFSDDLKCSVCNNDIINIACKKRGQLKKTVIYIRQKKIIKIISDFYKTNI